MKKLLLFLFLIIFFQVTAQEDAWIFLKDKPNTTLFLENPLTMLSQRALDRRSKLSIPLDGIDVPIDNTYYDQIKNQVNISILGKSKWLNVIHVKGEVTDINSLQSQFSFIDHIEFANKLINTNRKFKPTRIVSNHYHKLQQTLTDFQYGQADNQIKMLKGDYLHAQGLTGDGQIIAIIDAGFPNVNTLDAFQRIRENNQILGGYNFADRNKDIYTRNSHGTHVLSSIAGYVENEFVGTAPDANFYLFITEISETETVLEETLWVEAAERADSLGVDVINTSLGYTTYDNPNHSYSYQDMDGKTTFISRGAEIGASRGLLLVNAAGNSGNSSWKYIGAPADAPSVISVGAVNASKGIAPFSSFGPTADGRIKPEILGQGQNPALIDYSTGKITTSSSGTSFSSPIIAGLIACLNQREDPLMTSKTATDNLNTYLKSAVYESADRFAIPLDQYGYGIPNFETALKKYIGSFTTDDPKTLLSELTISPNPTNNFIRISADGDSLNGFSIQIFNILGRKILENTYLKSETIVLSSLKKGIYLLKVSKNNHHKIFKLIKK
ncbi:S8 family serine peptidase [Polaribacter sp.]|nr:S8 family serine peptidase [Polaribacter sp.]